MDVDLFPDPFSFSNGETHRAAGDRGGQAPALRFKKRHPLTVGRGPVPRHAWVDRNLAGDRPPRYDKNATPHRRAWALACHTRMRAGFPRQCPRNPTIAGDRPPRYGEKNGPRATGTSRPGGLSYRDASRLGGLSYRYRGRIRTVAAKVSSGDSTIIPAGMPFASKLIASVGQVYGSKQMASLPGGV